MIQIKRTLPFLLSIVLLTGCGLFGSKLPPEPTLVPTPTELPIAFKVNGQGYLLEDYQNELLRFQDAETKNGKTYSLEIARETIISSIKNDLLLAQAAAEQGFFVDQATLEQRFLSLVQKAGGNERVNAWMAQNHYDEASLKRTLARQMAAEWMERKIIDVAPTTAEQVHARQILLDNESEAAAVKAQIDAGADFKTLAFEYDALTGGDLGWFPRGYLFQPAVEEAAFALQVGQVSSVIRTSYGWHLIQVIERDGAHTLPADYRLKLQHRLLEDWLAERSANAKVEIFIS